MFIENYRLDTMIGGQAQSMIPYPKISDEDWAKWKAFLPVKAEVICKTELLGKPKALLHHAYGIPTGVCQEMTQGARHFDKIEVWAKRKISKDQIAVGLTGNGERYLICRWGVGGWISLFRPRKLRAVLGCITSRISASRCLPQEHYGYALRQQRFS